MFESNTWITILVALIGGIGGWAAYRRAKNEAPLVATQAQDIIIKNLTDELGRFEGLSRELAELKKLAGDLTQRVEDLEGENRELRRKNRYLQGRLTMVNRKLRQFGINPDDLPDEEVLHSDDA